MVRCSLLILGSLTILPLSSRAGDFSGDNVYILPTNPSEEDHSVRENTANPPQVHVDSPQETKKITVDDLRNNYGIVGKPDGNFVWVPPPSKDEIEQVNRSNHTRGEGWMLAPISNGRMERAIEEAAANPPPILKSILKFWVGAIVDAISGESKDRGESLPEMLGMPQPTPPPPEASVPLMD
jgi:hypothetical protein